MKGRRKRSLLAPLAGGSGRARGGRHWPPAFMAATILGVATATLLLNDTAALGVGVQLDLVIVVVGAVAVTPLAITRVQVVGRASLGPASAAAACSQPRTISVA